MAKKYPDSLSLAFLYSLMAHTLLLGALQPEWFAAKAVLPAARLAGHLAQPTGVKVATVNERTPSKLPATAGENLHAPSAVTSESVSSASTFRVPSKSQNPSLNDALKLTSAKDVPDSDERMVDAAGLRQFRLALASVSRQFKPVPERLHALSGTVEVQVMVAADGQGRRVGLKRSSGYAELDKDALEMLGAAIMQVSLPQSLRGRGLVVTMSVVFEAATVEND